MKKFFTIIILSSLILVSCGKTEEITNINNSEPVKQTQESIQTWSTEINSWKVAETSSWAVSKSWTESNSWNIQQVNKNYDWLLEATSGWNGSKTKIRFVYPIGYNINLIDKAVLMVKNKNDTEKYLQFQILEWDGTETEPFCAKYTETKTINTVDLRKFYTDNSCFPVPSDANIPFTAYIIDLENWTYMQIWVFWKEINDLEEIINTLKLR